MPMLTEMAGNTPRPRPTCPVDGHVHFHSAERVAMTLDAAADNFRRVRGAGTGDCLGALLLTQAGGERVFEALRDQPSCGDWRIRPVPDEEQSLLAERGETAIAVVCGRQVRCERGLEVTALGTTEEFADGRPLEDTIRELRASGALVSLPWGFGKWMGARGEQVRRALHQNDSAALAVCDNGSRLQLLGRPKLVQEAAALGYRVLPGTDPFPFGGDHRRAGSFGFLAAEPGRDRPWQDLRAWLDAQESSPPAYGAALGPVRFVINNVGIQFRNRRKRG
jgi:hypothetical protein